MSDYLLDTETLIKRLRYQGKQYQDGQQSRGGTVVTHMLTQAANKIEEQQKTIDKLNKVVEAAKELLDVRTSAIVSVDDLCDRQKKFQKALAELKG